MEGRNSLREYRDKRSGERTPEPFGGEVATGTGIFVVQKHAATRLHYDLRLEMGGVLKSWAVPKGISADPADKKLAVHVEDHPVEYAEFEGIIPEGEYGAGAVIVWDIGRWLPLEDPDEGLESGKLLFELRGHKLRGVWTLVKIKKSDTGKDWLLIRERKGGPVREDEVYPEESVFSGLTVDQLGVLDENLDPGAPVRHRLEELGARRTTVQPPDVKLMLAKTRDDAFSDPDWLFELKLDGYRMLAAGVDGRGLLLTRNGNDATASFPEVTRSLKRLPVSRVVLDGEIVVHDEAGLPSFQRLQRRARLSRPLDVLAASVRLPATFYAFDLLAYEDFDLRPLPLVERKRLLRMVIPPAGPLRYCDHFVENGLALYEQVQQMRLEGILAKRADSRYRGGRSGDWLKIHAARSGHFAVVGFTRPKGARSGFGALHLGVNAVDPGAVPSGSEEPVLAAEMAHFVYAGRVGTGFDEAGLTELREQLEPLRRDDAPLAPPFPDGAEHQWVEPELVARVRYKEWTDDGHLRQPVFEELVEMPAKECTREVLSDSEPAIAEPVRVEDRSPPAEEIPLSNLDKPFWPEDGYTKGDLIDYYRTIGPWLLPYLADRPLVLTRYPDGIHGKSFFQKHAPHFAPEWIRTETIWSEGSEREIDYFIAGDEATLVYLANLGTIPLHIWSSRLSALDRPDWCVLDLDPKEAPFSDVVAIARAIGRLCDEIDLPTFVKTSGSTGLHILIPLGGQLEYDQSRSLGALLARLIVGQLPDLATTERQPARREGKVYIDYIQNGRGRLIVAPYSVRPIVGAPVSAPLRWKEVGSKLEIGQYTIRSMPRRVRALNEDPLLPVLETRPDLLGALERLHTRLEDET